VTIFLPAMYVEMILEVKDDEGRKMTWQEADRKGGKECGAGKRNTKFYRRDGCKKCEKVAEEWVSSAGKLVVRAKKAGEHKPD
jgi:hypothetical protein